MHLTVAPASRRADLHQEAVIGQPAPDVTRAQLTEVHPIPADGIGVEVGNRQFVKNAVVRRLRALVADHVLDRLTRAMVVALAVSAVRSFEHVRADKDRADSALRARDFDNNEPFTAHNLFTIHYHLFPILEVRQLEPSVRKIGETLF